MKKQSRWKRAGRVEYDDHAAVIVYQGGKPKRVKRWLQVARFIKGPKRG